MSHGPEHQIEHAEHAAHASHDSFDKQVTISIAIVAAVLAAVTMLGHRAHNETLQLQGEAGIQHNAATNKWAQYQASNIRDHLYQSLLELSASLPAKSDSKETQGEIDAARQRWQDQRNKYKKNLPEYKGEAETLEEQSKAKIGESHVTHARGTRFDIGELGLQLGVVLCSLAILTKMKSFWYAGLLGALAGLLVALTGVFGLFLGGGHH